MLTEEQYKTAKKYGFQDKTIKRLAQVDTLPVENYRAGFKMVDTCAAEFSANTPYFYSTYDGDNEAASFIAEKEAETAAKGEPKKKKVLVFGSGPIRIGQGIEFDYCSVHCVWTLKKNGCEAILVNNNPETVSKTAATKNISLFIVSSFKVKYGANIQISFLINLTFFKHIIDNTRQIF